MADFFMLYIRPKPAFKELFSKSQIWCGEKHTWIISWAYSVILCSSEDSKCVRYPIDIG
jgi:hypothetical protein